MVLDRESALHGLEDCLVLKDNIQRDKKLYGNNQDEIVLLSTISRTRAMAKIMVISYVNKPEKVAR